MSPGNRFSMSHWKGRKPIVQRRHVISRKTEVLKLLVPQERAWNMEQILCSWLLVNLLVASEKLLKPPNSITEFENYWYIYKNVSGLTTQIAPRMRFVWWSNFKTEWLMLWFFLLVRLNTSSFSRTSMHNFRLGITRNAEGVRSLKKTEVAISLVIRA